MDDTATRLGAKIKTISSSKLMGKQSGGQSALGKVGDKQSNIGTLAKIVRHNRIKINSIEKTIKSFDIKFKDIQKNTDNLKDDIDKINNKSNESKDDDILKSILSELTSIKSIVESISNSLAQQQKNQERAAETARIGASKESKRKREEQLEKKSSSSGGVKQLEQAAEPAISFFDRIINFFKMILIGGALEFLLNIIKDPQILLKPLQDVVNNIINFFNGIIKWIDNTLIQPLRGIVDALNSGLKSIVDALNGIINTIPSWMPLKPSPISAPPQIPQIPALPQIPPATFATPNIQTQNTGGKVVNINQGDTIKGDTINRTIINVKDLKFKSGGMVDPTSGITIEGLGPDTQLIAAQPGEIVMNKSAVDGYGADKLLKINSIFGGSNANKPKSVKSGKIISASGGGYAGGKIKYFSSNDKGNKILQPGQTYRFSDLRGHSHNPGMREDGYPKDYTVLHGTDLNSSPNADIPTPLDAEVTHKGQFSGYGNGVRITTAAGPLFFAHLSRFGNINVGDKIKAGTIIGTQGNTGGAYVDHLHINSSAAGHEAFVNYITSGKPTFGSTTGTSGSDSSSSSSPPESSSGTDYSSILSKFDKYGFLIKDGAPQGNNTTVVGSPSATGAGSMQSSTAKPNQTAPPSFSSEDSMNPSSLVVRSIYNIVG